MSNAEPRFGRLITAMVTPFNDERELDLDRAQALATRLIEGGNDSLIINGTTGESPPRSSTLRRSSFSAPSSRRSAARPPSSPTWGTTARPTPSTSPRTSRNSVSTALCASSRTTTSLRKRECTSTSRPLRMRWSLPLSSTTSRAAALSTWKLRPRCASPTTARTSSP